jgi:hypothetical protein
LDHRVTKTDFFVNLTEYSSAQGFVFLHHDDALNEPKRPSAGQQAIYTAISAIGFGLIGAALTGYFEKLDKEQLITDLNGMQGYCDLVGINLSKAIVLLRLAIDADDLSNDGIIGRFAQIHSRARDFQKYAMSLAFAGKMSVRTQGLIVFTSHKRAKDFGETSGSQCKHSSFWDKIYTEAWVIDLEDEEITRFRHGGEFMARDLREIKQQFFRKRT